MSPALAWIVLIIGFVLPLLHVAFSRDIAAAPGPGGETGDQAGGRCPFSPRAGWIVLVLLLGPVGWLMFMGSRRKKRAMMAARARREAGPGSGAGRE